MFKRATKELFGGAPPGHAYEARTRTRPREWRNGKPNAPAQATPSGQKWKAEAVMCSTNHGGNHSIIDVIGGGKAHLSKEVLKESPEYLSRGDRVELVLQQSQNHSLPTVISIRLK